MESNFISRLKPLGSKQCHPKINKMNYVGIIAEYNPFHSGHGHHIAKTREYFQNRGEDSTIIIIMSGHWVQQANCAITDKWTRTKLALEGGADLIIELPTPWATASAQTFARGAISLLQSTGLITHLSFGSEGGDIHSLQEIANSLEHPDYPSLLKEALKSGVSFPTAREKALHSLLGDKSNLLKLPNNTLGLEYLSALSYFKSNITPMTILREGSGFHNIVTTEEIAPTYTSATDLRSKLQENQWEYTKSYLSPQAISHLKETKLPSLKNCEPIFLSKLCTMTTEDWSELPDSGKEEGLPQRLSKIGHSVSSTEAFLTQAKTKRYTHARLRRLLLCAFLGITANATKKYPPYLRILGFNKSGQTCLHHMKSLSTCPILTKTASVHHLNPDCQSLFTNEVAYTDLYRLCFPEMPPIGLEWKKSPVIVPSNTALVYL